MEIEVFTSNMKIGNFWSVYGKPKFSFFINIIFYNFSAIFYYITWGPLKNIFLKKSHRILSHLKKGENSRIQ
jgi:F0F1-type ATP synthase membrane subunit b/b'